MSWLTAPRTSVLREPSVSPSLVESATVPVLKGPDLLTTDLVKVSAVFCYDLSVKFLHPLHFAQYIFYDCLLTFEFVHEVQPFVDINVLFLFFTNCADMVCFYFEPSFISILFWILDTLF